MKLLSDFVRASAVLDFLKSVGWLANVGHFLGGYAVILTGAFWSSGMHGVITASWLLGIYTVFKEYVVDLIWESGETVGSSTIDAMGYAAGALVAWTEVLLR